MTEWQPIAKHEHVWKPEPIVLDFNPPIYFWACSCGAVRRQCGDDITIQSALPSPPEA